MRDYFALLGEPRRPWLDPEALRAKFLMLSATVHPDRAHGGSVLERRAAQERYVELNAAYTCLREPKERLRHLLELERGVKPEVVENVPTNLLDHFFAVSQLCREVDRFLHTKASTSSPVLKARAFEEAQQWNEQIEALLGQVDSARRQWLEELRASDRDWERVAVRRCDDSERRLLLARLEELYRRLGFYGRWTAQLQERKLQLAM